MATEEGVSQRDSLPQAGMLRRVEHQLRLLDIVLSAQTAALSIGTSCCADLRTDESVYSDSAYSASASSDCSETEGMERRVEEHDRELRVWLQRLHTEGRHHKAQLESTRQRLPLERTREGRRNSTATHRRLAVDSPVTLTETVDARDAAQPPPHTDPPEVSIGIQQQTKPLATSAKPSPAESERRVVRLNVGGTLFCTTLTTLRATPSMLSLMFSDRYPYEADELGVFIDRDGPQFRHVLNYLRGGELQLCRDAASLRELGAEAHFYQLPGLEQLVAQQLAQLECRGDRLRELSMGSVVAETRGLFEKLLMEIYQEVESQASQGKRLCTVAFLQEKVVNSVLYRSQTDGCWDKRILDCRYHKLLSNMQTQQLLCSRLERDGLRADIKALCGNREAQNHQWVATTTFILTVTIWEPISSCNSESVNLSLKVDQAGNTEMDQEMAALMFRRSAGSNGPAITTTICSLSDHKHNIIVGT